ncbi:MAG: GGDEF domain-containing protein, partial [Pseudomonadota bacterium]
GLTCAAAMTRPTAEDYLAGGGYSGIIFDISQSPRRMCDLTKDLLADGAGRGRSVFIIATITQLRSGNLQPLIDEAEDIFVADDRATHMAARISRRLRRRLSSEPLQPATPGLMAYSDAETSLFNECFFTAHLAAQMNELSGSPLPLSLIVFDLESIPPALTPLSGILPKLAGYLKSQLRDTDCPARLSPKRIAISLRGSGHADAERLAQRVERMVCRTQTGWSDVKLAWRIVERRQYHSAEGLLASAIDRLPTQPIAAA